VFKHPADLRSVWVCKQLSHQIVERLNVSRRQIKYKFGKMVGYIFWGWGGFEESRKTLKVWPYEGQGPDGEQTRLYSLGDIKDVPVLGGKKEEVTTCIDHWRRNHYV